MVAFTSRIISPRTTGDLASLYALDAPTMRLIARPLVAGRMPDPRRADEAVVNEVMRDRFGLDIGSTMLVGSDPVDAAEFPPGLVVPGGATRIRQKMRVVGISKSVSSDPDWTPSSGYFAKHGDHMPGVVNLFVDLRGGAAAIPKFTERVDQILGHPVNIEDARDLYGIRKALNVTDFETDGLLLFAFAALRRWRRARRPGAGARGVGERRRPHHVARARCRSTAGDAGAGAALVGQRVRRCRRVRRGRDRAVVALPARHRARLRPRPRHARRLARARRRGGRRARRRARRSPPSPRGGG